MKKNEKKEKLNFLQRFFKRFNVFALIFAMLFTGSILLTACSPSEPSPTPPGIVNPKPEDDKEEDNNNTGNEGDENPDEKEDLDKGNEGEEGEKGEEGNEGDTGDNEEGDAGDDEVDVSTLLYYTDDQGETHYNVEKMIESCFAQYNTRMMNNKPFAYTIARVYEMSDKNITILASRFNTEAEGGSQLELLVIADTDDNSKHELIKIEQKIDLDAVGGDKITDLDTYFSSVNNKKVMPNFKILIRTFDSTFVPGEDEVADYIVDIIKVDTIIDSTRENEANPDFESEANPDFEYVLGFRTAGKQGVSGYVRWPDGHFESAGARVSISTYFLVNKNENLYLLHYMTYSAYESNITKHYWKECLKLKVYYFNDGRASNYEQEVFTNYTLEYQRENPNLIYYEDEQGVTHYNTEKMVDTMLSVYGNSTHADYMAGVNKFNKENTKILMSRFNTETSPTQLEAIISVKDDDGINRLIKFEQKMDLDAVGENSILALHDYYNFYYYNQGGTTTTTLTTFDLAFMPGDDEVADAVTNLIKEYKNSNGEVVSNPDFKYLYGFRTLEEVGDAGTVIFPNGEVSTATTRMLAHFYFLVNKNGDVCLLHYIAYADVEQNYDLYQDQSKTFLANLQNKEYYLISLEEEKVLYTNFIVESEEE